MSKMLTLFAAKNLKEEANTAYKQGTTDAPAKALLIYQRICDASVSPPDFALQRICRNNMALCHFDLGQLQLCLDVAREVIRASPSCPSDADNSQTTKAIYRAAKALNSLNDYSEALSMLESITGPQHHGYVPELKERILFMQRLHPKPIPGPGETLFLYRSKCCSNVWKHTYDFQIALNPNTIGSHSFLVLVRSFVAIVDPLLESDLSILCAMCKKRRASAHLHAPMLYLSRKWIVDWTIGTCSAACDLEAEKKMVEMGATVI